MKEMTENLITEILQSGSEWIEKGEYEKAIDDLRSLGPPNDKDLCSLLSKAYFLRGDSRGDIYSSHYFATRAIELGAATDLLYGILAMSAFKKGLFQESTSAFSKFVTEDSAANTKYLYGLSLFYDGKSDDALKWIKAAKDAQPENAEFLRAFSDLSSNHGQANKNALSCRQPTPNIYESITETLTSSKQTEIDTPHKFNVLSKLRGHGSEAKDFDWLEKNIPCQKACPAGTNIPEYLAAIYSGDHDRAYKINLWDNVFPAVLGRVCSRPCESECRHGWDGLGESVAICFSKRSASDFKRDDRVVLKPIFPSSGKAIGIIGSGVAGLTAARNLALFGHDVTVFEKQSYPGGIMNQGIPEFRLPREIIDREIDQIRQQGVRIQCDSEIGQTVKLQTLIDDYDAIIMAAGTFRPNILDLPGKNLKGIRHGLDFLLEANQSGSAPVGREVIVIGGGFTAMDCARTAQRLGAEQVRMHKFPAPSAIRVVYRRSQEEMLVTPGELEELNHEGIPMDFMVTPIEYIGDGKGMVKALKLIRTELGEPDESGRRRPVSISGSEFEIEVDTVLLATGQFPDTKWIDGNLADSLVADDDWLRSEQSTSTSCPNLFVAGDFATGALTLIDAIAHAKRCARDVDEFLMGSQRISDAVTVQDATGPGRIREMDFVPLQSMPMIPLEERTLKAEVETGYTKKLAVEETQRCYLCHYKYEIDSDKCIYCDWCIKAKPRPDCIVKVSSLDYDDNGRITGFNRASESDDTNLIFINQEDCIRCNACVEACPVDCISVQKVSMQTLTEEKEVCGYTV